MKCTSNGSLKQVKPIYFDQKVSFYNYIYFWTRKMYPNDNRKQWSLYTWEYFEKKTF